MAYRGWRVAENPTVSGSGETGHRRKGPHQSAKGIVLECSQVLSSSVHRHCYNVVYMYTVMYNYMKYVHSCGSTSLVNSQNQF